jgi:two-component system sensor histidine kinase AtoS
MLVMAAPLTPFVGPFQRAATSRTIVLLVGSVVALLLAATLASRLGGSVRRLAVAADEIARGNLGKRIVTNGTREVGQLAESFNRMTTTLEQTLSELSSRASLAAVGEFAASLAHEIRNPLTAIRVDLQYLTRHGSPTVADGEALGRAIRQVDRLDHAVSAALDLARGGAVHLSPVALDPVVQDAVASVGPEASARGVRVRSALIVKRLTVLADAGALHQLLLNVLLNAVQAADATGGEVQIDTAVADDRVTLTVADDGVGVRPEDAGRVFDPFYTTRPGGSGLGLAIARRIAIAHGGAIAIAARAPRGSVVTVTLRHAGAAAT